PEGRPTNRRITAAMLDDGTLPNFEGDPVSGLVWLEDGEHFLQIKEGELLRVHAVTGRSQPYSGALAPRELVARGGPQGKGAKGAVKPGGRELVTPSPNKKTTAFVRNNNLYFEDAQTKKERALTADGSELVRNGKADWVYYEEVF